MLKTMGLTIVLIGVVYIYPDAHASSDCKSYIGKTVGLTSRASIEKSLSTIRPKDDFETTADYRSKIEKIGKKLPKIIYIEKTFVESSSAGEQFIKYNADTQVLRFQTYAFRNEGILLDEKFYRAVIGRKGGSFGTDVKAILTRQSSNNGTYEASNAYGKKVTVQKIKQNTFAVFDTRFPEIGLDFFPGVNKNTYAIAELSLPPAEAKNLVNSLKIGFVVAPKYPYLFRGSHKVGKTTINRPFDVTEDYTFLIADIQCGIIMNSKYEILRSHPTL